MSRPTFPTWATDTNYPAGSDDWSGQTTKSAPSSGKMATGFTPFTADPAEETNWLFNALCLVVAYLDQSTGQFGDGSDGDLTFDGTSTVHGLVPSSHVYTATGPIFANNLTVTGSTTQLNMAGYPLFVKGTLTTPGSGHHVNADGGAGVSGASGGTGASASPSGTFGGGGAGGNNVDVGGGTNGGSTTGYGGNGGDGGQSGGFVPARSGGVATQLGTTAGNPRQYSQASVGHVIGISGITNIQGGAGGGGGGGDGSGNHGGGGGAGGGVLVVAANTLALGAANDLTAFGGNGGNAQGTGGGGGGGGGGVLLLYYRSKNSVTFSAATNCAGGTKGSTGGVTAFNGANGSVYEVALS